MKSSQKANGGFRQNLRRAKASSDELCPIRNPGTPGQAFIRDPQYADIAFKMCAPGIGMQAYDKIRGQNNEDFGHKMLHKQRLHKPAELTQDEIASTPNYLSREVDNGRNTDTLPRRRV